MIIILMILKVFPLKISKSIESAGVKANNNENKENNRNKNKKNKKG